MERFFPRDKRADIRFYDFPRGGAFWGAKIGLIKKLDKLKKTV